MPDRGRAARGDDPARSGRRSLPEQAQAVTHGTGPLLLLAGPGAGKTRTLTHCAADLLASGRAQPCEILIAERGRRPTGGPSRFLTEAGLLDGGSAAIAA